MEYKTVAKGDIAYPGSWSPANVNTIQEQMGRPAGEALIIVDGTSHIVYANTGVADLFGWDVDELVGLPLNALIPQRHHRDHLAHIRSFVDSNTPGRTIERPGLWARVRTGTTFECALTIARVGSGENAALAASIRPR